LNPAASTWERESGKNIKTYFLLSSSQNVTPT